MANPTITELQTMFKQYAGDSSLDTTTMNFRLQEPYEDARKLLWDTKARGMLPLTIEDKTAVNDTANGRYITIPNTASVWSVYMNQILEFVDDGTNYKLYLKKGNTTQKIVRVAEQALPTGTDTSNYKRDLCRIIVMYAVADYFAHIKSYEEELRMKKRADDKKNELLM
jgi:hypothetical protein